MNKKIVLIGVVIVLVALVGAVAITKAGHADDAADDDALSGYWYTVAGKVYINGIGYQDVMSDECEFPKSFSNLRITECRDSVFHGTFAGQMVAGSYFDDGRVVFKYMYGDEERFFDGYYKDGLIYGVTLGDYDFDTGSKMVLYTFILSTDPYKNADFKTVPSIEGSWKAYEGFIIVGGERENISGTSLSINDGSQDGLFTGNMEFQIDGNTVYRNVWGVIVNIAVHDAHFGYLYDTVTKERWTVTYDEHHLSLQSVVNSEVVKGNPLVPVTRSYSRDGVAVQHDYPNVDGKLYYPFESSFACNHGGTGKIMDSNNTIVMMITSQVGPSIAGKILIRGTPYEMSGTIDCQGHMVICYMRGNEMMHMFAESHEEGMVQVGAWVRTQEMGNVFHYDVLKAMPYYDLYEDDPQCLIGDWSMSSASWSTGRDYNVFSDSPTRMSLNINSVEGNLIRGTFVGIAFEGTYGPTVTGQGSLWFTLPTGYGTIECEFILGINGVLNGMISYFYEGEGVTVTHIGIVVYTRDYQYSLVPDIAADVYDKTWEATSVELWDGKRVNSMPDPANAVGFSIEPLRHDSKAFFEGTLTIKDGDDALSAETFHFTGAFYLIGLKGNSTSYAYCEEFEQMSITYNNGRLSFIAMGLDDDGSLMMCKIIFKDVGTSTKDVTPKKYGLLGSTFEKGDFSLTINNQSDSFVYGTLRHLVDGKVQKLQFIGMIVMSKSTHIEAMIVSANGKVGSVHITLGINSFDDVTHIVFEATWLAESHSRAVSFIAYRK